MKDDQNESKAREKVDDEKIARDSKKFSECSLRQNSSTKSNKSIEQNENTRTTGEQNSLEQTQKLSYDPTVTTEQEEDLQDVSENDDEKQDNEQLEKKFNSSPKQNYENKANLSNDDSDKTQQIKKDRSKSPQNPNTLREQQEVVKEKDDTKTPINDRVEKNKVNNANPDNQPNTENSQSSRNTFAQLPIEMTRNFPPALGANYIQFQQMLCNWEWYSLDGAQIPVIFRDNKRLTAVHAVQRILSKFPSNIPSKVAERHIMVSHMMHPIEAWLFNIINTTVCGLELGCYVYTPNDELVNIESVTSFYWVVKQIHLSNLAKFYESELLNVNAENIMLHASITQLKQLIEIEVAKTETKITSNSIPSTSADLSV